MNSPHEYSCAALYSPRGAARIKLGFFPIQKAFSMRSVLFASNPLPRQSTMRHFGIRFGFGVGALLLINAFASQVHAQAQELSKTQAVATTAGDARFPFVMPWDDASKTVIDVSRLNPAPLTDKHRIAVKGAHFYDQSGRRVRFLGTDFAAGANFSSHADAAKVAARMHKLGFNIVRLHHMDSPWAKPNIFGDEKRDNYNLASETIDAGSLDKLDYLVSQFKKNGIYVDLNLHVGWVPSAAAGFPDADKFDAVKTIPYFEKRTIEHQRNYARQFMTHVNPYTKRAWAEDPTVALVEIDNEDTLLSQGWSDNLINLPPYYRDQLAAKWNAWLLAKYKTGAAMQRAWTGNRELGENILQNARFDQTADAAKWYLERAEGEVAVTYEAADMSTHAADETVPTGNAAHLGITQLPATAEWKQQFQQGALNLKNGETYSLQFWAKSSAPRAISLGVGMDQAPWDMVGGSGRFDLTPQWKRFSLVFTANNAIPNHSRISWTVGNALGDIWLADVSLRPGVVFDLAPDQTLETQTLPLVQANGTPQGRDMISFLMSVERDFSVGMRDYIKKDLKSKSLVACSQASYGGLGGVLRESRMDWIDTHAYWQHPNFPHKSWDQRDWNIPNTAMVRDLWGGTLPGLAQHRVEGMPLTVTEYNHPAPNQFASETMPLIASYAAAQDWDGLFLFDYNGGPNWNENKIRGFFDSDSDPNKMAAMPAAAMIFLGAQVKPIASNMSTLVVPRDAQAVSDIMANSNMSFWSSNLGQLWGREGATRRDWLDSRMAIRLVDGKGPLHMERALHPTTSSNPISWQATTPDAALYSIDAPSAKGLIGFIGGQWAQSGALLVSMDKTERNFATILLNARDGLAVEKSRSLLLTAISDVQNSGMQWNADHTSVGDQWGTGPTMAAGVPANVMLRTQASSATVYALDSRGARVQSVSSTLKNGVLSFRIGAAHRALWYEIATVFEPMVR